METKFFGEPNRNKFLKELIKVFKPKFANKKDVDELIDSIGKSNGIASLDGSGKVPSEELPSYVDDVVEYANFESLPEQGEGGKIYVTTDNNQQYRWSGSTYIPINEGVIKGDGINKITKLSAQEYEELSEKDAETIYITEEIVQSDINYKLYLNSVLVADSAIFNEIETLLASI